MSDELLRKLEECKNPLTNRSLLEEKRQVTLNREGDLHRISYVRDGIDLKNKKIIEDSFYQILQNHGVKEDDIAIMSQSLESEQAKQPAAAATLAQGHGPRPKEKRRIEGVTKVVAVASGKGGVGKSTVSVNLAYALIGRGKKVGLIDADVYGPSLPMMLGKRRERPGANEQKKILPVEAAGLKFVSFGQFIEEGEPVIWRGPMLGGVLNQFFFDVDWSPLDVLLIDLPPGTGDVQLSTVQLLELDGAVIVTTPQDVALLDSIKGLKMFEKMEIDIVGIIENMSFFVCNNCGERHHLFGEGGGQRAAKDLSANFLGAIPLEANLRDSADGGRPYMNNPDFRNSPVWKSYMDIAKSFDNIIFKKQGFLKNLFG